jgi:predicted metal-dependent peptidase
MMDTTPSIETKLAAARARLILERPFIGTLLMHLPFEPAGRIDTIATDARRLYFNPAYIERLSLAETQFALAHATMHCALGHFARRGHRVRRRWDVACDHAVNLLLIEDGMTAPTGALRDARYRGLGAEEIYPLIAEEAEDETLDRHLFGSDAGGAGAASEQRASKERPEPDSPGGDGQARAASDDDSWSDAASHARRNPGADADAHSMESAPPLDGLADAWRMRLAAAAHQARHAGRLGASWQRLLERFIEPQLPWRALLARYLLGAARDDYSFQRPSRREGEALLPRLSSGRVEVFAILDTSGSVSDAELQEFAAEIDALKGQVRARVTLHACDSALAPGGPWTFEAWEPMVFPQHLAGGGGTDFSPVFEWIARESLRPDVLVYFTDAEGEFPPVEPSFPVIWLVKGRAQVPWGERVQLN